MCQIIMFQTFLNLFFFFIMEIREGRELNMGSPIDLIKPTDFNKKTLFIYTKATD